MNQALKDQRVQDFIYASRVSLFHQSSILNGDVKDGGGGVEEEEKRT